MDINVDKMDKKSNLTDAQMSWHDSRVWFIAVKLPNSINLNHFIKMYNFRVR